jgi:hypothetical protein
VFLMCIFKVKCMSWVLNNVKYIRDPPHCLIKAYSTASMLFEIISRFTRKKELVFYKTHSKIIQDMTLRLLCANCFKSVHNIEVVFCTSAYFLSEDDERILVKTKRYTYSPRLPILSIYLFVGSLIWKYLCTGPEH